MVSTFTLVTVVFCCFVRTLFYSEVYKKPATKTIPLPFVADTFYLQILYDVFPYAAFLSGFASYLNRSIFLSLSLILSFFPFFWRLLSSNFWTDVSVFCELITSFRFFFVFLRCAVFRVFVHSFTPPPRTTFVHINVNILSCPLSSVFFIFVLRYSLHFLLSFL